MAKYLGAVLGMISAACSGSAGEANGCHDNSSCRAGQVCVFAECLDICLFDGQCGAGRICEGDVCVVGTRSDTPRITRVVGNGSSACSAGTTQAACMASGVIVEGANLSGVEVTLLPAAGGLLQALTTVAQDDARIEALLPTDVVAGSTYILGVQNAAGEAQASVTLLQGEPGPSLTADELVLRINEATTDLIATVLPIGTAAGSVAAGDHAHAFAELTAALAPALPAVPAGASAAIIDGVTVSAASDCGTVAPTPHMQLFVNRELVGESDVPNAGATDYSFSVTPPRYVSEVAVAFTNDTSSGGCDHNLKVQSITLSTAGGSVTLPANDAAHVFFDRGDFFDNIDVLPATNNVLWTGALRFLLAPPAPAHAAPQTVCAVLPATGGTVACPAGKTVLFALAGRPFTVPVACPARSNNPDWGFGIDNEVPLGDDAGATCDDLQTMALGCAGSASCSFDGNTASCNRSFLAMLLCL